SSSKRKRRTSRPATKVAWRASKSGALKSPARSEGFRAPSAWESRRDQSSGYFSTRSGGLRRSGSGTPRLRPTRKKQSNQTGSSSKQQAGRQAERRSQNSSQKTTNFNQSSRSCSRTRSHSK